MANIIHIEHISFTYPEEEGRETFAALDGVTLDIEAGSFVAVLGHNGSGKSTLAKHMNAVLLPTGGKVYVDGMDTWDEEVLLEIRRRVGMVFQNPDNQIVANVVEEDVAFGPENLGVPTEEIRRRVGRCPEGCGHGVFPAPRPTRDLVTTSPAARSSASPSPASSPWSRSASSWTSPPPCWTPAAAGRCWTRSGG